MFVLNPDPYLLPSYRISPFQTHRIGNRSVYPTSEVAKTYFNERFGEGNWLITRNGREAIKLALESLDVGTESTVTILTTSNNRYISSCVTNAIAMKCQWNRQVNEGTDVIFVNHEFGYPFPRMREVLNRERPVIEDCCTAFYSQDRHGKLGDYGDYSIFSFPKFFNMQLGGLLVGKDIGAVQHLRKRVSLTMEEHTYLLGVLGEELYGEGAMLLKRKKIFDYAAKRFQEMGFGLRFPNRQGLVPSVLLLRNNGVIGDLPALKEFLYQHGIQNSLFYGEDAFFLPCHQNLTERDIDYFSFVISHFISRQ